MSVKRVTQQEKETMWKLYQNLGTFKAVAKKLHRDPATVSRHIHEYEAAVNTAGIILKQKEL